ncbi:unnamed protein product [Prunus armeniaca]
MDLASRREMMSSNIDDLPELLLAEIICRLSSNKLVFQCKCVSKRWCELISSPYFVCYFMRLQRELQKPILSTLVAAKTETNTGTFFPMLGTTSISGDREEEKEEERLCSLPPSLSMQLPIISEAALYVVGACNDLLLCCPTRIHQRYYYICNPYTKQWVALPPTRRVLKSVVVGFICDPYYSYSDSSSSTSSLSKKKVDNDVCINVEYRWRVVRVFPNFCVDIFLSENGEWRESKNPVVCLSELVSVLPTGVAYNGKLYWPCYNSSNSYVFELDPFSISISSSSNNIIVDKCRLNRGPFRPSPYPALFACRRCLRLFPQIQRGPSLNVWELEEDKDQELVVTETKAKASDDNLMMKWHLVVEDDYSNDDLCSYEINEDDFFPCSTALLGFHPNNEDIIYFRNIQGAIIMFNVVKRTVELVPEIRGIDGYRFLATITYPFILPWWPTPVPSL